MGVEDTFRLLSEHILARLDRGDIILRCGVPSVKCYVMLPLAARRPTLSRWARCAAAPSAGPQSCSRRGTVAVSDVIILLCFLSMCIYLNIIYYYPQYNTSKILIYILLV